MSADEWRTETEWRAQAACTNTDTAVFFGARHLQQAARVCGECPVASECAEHAEATGAVGVWGGRLWPGGQRVTEHTSSRSHNYAGCGVDERCGTSTGYYRGGRCDQCKNSERLRRAATRRTNKVVWPGCGVDPRCGTLSGYRAGGRCDKCADTQRAYSRRVLARAAANYAGCGVDPRCGTRPGYRVGGRCDQCTSVQAEYDRERKGRTPKPYQGCGADPRCGGIRGYDLGGRCTSCKAADINRALAARV